MGIEPATSLTINQHRTTELWTSFVCPPPNSLNRWIQNDIFRGAFSSPNPRGDEGRGSGMSGNDSSGTEMRPKKVGNGGNGGRISPEFFESEDHF